MKRLNLYLTLTSLTVVAVTLERFSPTTKILLQPDNYLRLHEVFQMSVLILASVLIPCFVLYHVTNGFRTVKSNYEKFLVILFAAGIYFYATGNGAHEIASFLFNNYCPQNNFATAFCKSSFFDDYYFGNIMYFFGAFFMTVPILLLERLNPTKDFTKKDYIILIINSLVYSLAIIAYAALDRVLVGLVYTLITTIVIDGILFTSKIKYKYLPYTFYSAVVYTIGAVISLLIRFR